jgi:DNA replication initiation complex subunit (GINS family)
MKEVKVEGREDPSMTSEEAGDSCHMVVKYTAKLSPAEPQDVSHMLTASIE